MLSHEQVVLLEVAALGLLVCAAGGDGARRLPSVCADAAVAAILQSSPAPPASCTEPIIAAPAADDDADWRSLPYIMQQTVACLLPATAPPCLAINLVAPQQDGRVHLSSCCADCSDAVLLLVCACSGGALLPHTFIASSSRCVYLLGSSVACEGGGSGRAAAAVYVLQQAPAARSDDVFVAAAELSDALDACYEDDDGGGGLCGDRSPVSGGDDDDEDDAEDDVDSIIRACPLGFFMSPRATLAPPASTSASPIAATAATLDFSPVSCLSIQCIGLAPLRRALVQHALHALLHGTMHNLVSLALRLLPTSLILPDLHNALSRLTCLKHLALQFDQCSSSDSASIVSAVAQLPQLCSMELLGLDLSTLLQPSSSFSLSAPISCIAFRDNLPPPFAVSAVTGGGSAPCSTAASMPLSHIAVVVSACSSTLQSLAVSGKQVCPHQQ